MTTMQRRALIEEQRPYVLEQIEHMRKHGHLFSEWVVLFITIEDGDEDAKRLARGAGWKEESGNDFLSTLVQRADLCRVMRDLGIGGVGIVEQPIKPGMLRCVVIGGGCGIHDVDVPVSMNN